MEQTDRQSRPSAKRQVDRDAPHWLYRMYNAAGDLLYIGITVNPKQRLALWRSRGSNPWFSAVTSICWRQYPDRWKASCAEEDAIKAEHPRHNVLHRRAPSVSVAHVDAAGRGNSSKDAA